MATVMSEQKKRVGHPPHYGSTLGRFLQIDPANVGALLPEPQTWNAYAYVGNNPLRFIDPLGLQKSDETPPQTAQDTCAQMQPRESEACTHMTEARTGQNSANCQATNNNPCGAPAQQMALSQKGLEFIKRHEGFSDTVYEDSAGNPTIGYGHLIKKGEDFSKGITQEKAAELLEQDVKTAVHAVNSKVEVRLSQNKFDALVDFAFNLGRTNFANSTLLRNINEEKDVTKENFTEWNRAGGKTVKGLTIRRTDEFNLFSKGDYGGS
jgi:lysozyme